MKAFWLVAVLLAAGLARADGADSTRGLLYRIDADARSVRLHPTNSTGPAQALSRTANDAADRLRAEGLPSEGAALKREAAGVAAAARNHEDEDTRAHAIRVEQLVRQLDEQLPAHDARF
jgi:hypothetical protein